MEILKNLNDKQQEAVVFDGKSLLVLAGAGSGKTRVVTHRIAHLISKGASPDGIFAVTFTNKAAEEMRSRVEKLVGSSIDDMWIKTFHSACARILRENAEHAGLKNNFVIYDGDDSGELLKECFSEMGLDTKRINVNAVMHMIERAKDRLFTPAELESAERKKGNPFSARISDVYRLYDEKLERNNAVDFGGLIFNAVRMLAGNRPVLQKYREKFRHVLVDEFQDTNYGQYALIKLLAAGCDSVCVVGDDDQSIYGWRGAEYENIFDFDRNLKGTRVVKLERNYRSTPNILNAANKLIKNNSSRRGKKLYTEIKKGRDVEKYLAQNEHDEADYIASMIKHLTKYDKYSAKDIAIFYRMHFLSRTIEDTLMAENIPYRIYGGVGFYERKEVKDIFAYLKLISNPSDALSFKRAIGVPKRGVGKTSIEKLSLYSKLRGISIFETAGKVKELDSIQDSAAEEILGFYNLVSGFIKANDKISLTELVKMVIDKVKYKECVMKENEENAEDRLAIVDEIVSQVTEFEKEEESPKLDAFLEKYSLLTDHDAKRDGKDSVTLMTLHCAKGLEFPVVFVMGLEEGIFPMTKKIDDVKSLEEERRLCYVGMTRAKDVLFLTSSETRTRYGSRTFCVNSRFLNEVFENGDVA